MKPSKAAKLTILMISIFRSLRIVFFILSKYWRKNHLDFYLKNLLKNYEIMSARSKMLPRDISLHNIYKRNSLYHLVGPERFERSANRSLIL